MNKHGRIVADTVLPTVTSQARSVLQRHAAEGLTAEAPGNALTTLQRAAAETSRPLDGPVRKTLETGLARDFSRVRVHSGPHSARAAERIGARAYTLGNDIHLGTEAHSLPARERSHLLTHEAVHTLQQGGNNWAPHAGLTLSAPNDAAEIQAEQIAGALHGSARTSARQGGGLAVAPNALRAAPAQLQRDLSGKYPVREGDFALDLKTESHPHASSGLKGTIKFNANDKASDAASIRLLQVVRTEDLSTSKDLQWHGGEANRNKVMTGQDKSHGIEGGYFVDKLHSKLNPRSGKADAAASPYYIDDYPGTAASGNKDGSKKGHSVSEASLWDFPHSSEKIRFSFETTAQAPATGHVFGTVMWGFTISDPARGTIEKERAVGRNVTLATTDKAIANFNEFYRNPGASTAPK
jgi:hypothetical protein